MKISRRRPTPRRWLRRALGTAATTLVLTATAAPVAWSQGAVTVSGPAMNEASSDSGCCQAAEAQWAVDASSSVPPVAAMHGGDLLRRLEASSDWQTLAIAIELAGPTQFFDPATVETRLLQAADRLTADKKVTEPRHLAAAQLRLQAVDAMVARGRQDEARTTLDKLGLITAWQVVGPFENRNMAGFDVNYAPEQLAAMDDTFEGKGGTRVGWRPLETTVGGYVGLAEAVNPNRSAIVYAATTIDSPRAQKVVLRMGVEGAYKVWVNGKLVGRVDTDYAGRLDHDAFAVELGKGENTVLVKAAGENRGRLGFFLRFTDAAGAPVALTARPALKAGARLASPDKARVPFEVLAPAEAATAQARAAVDHKADHLLAAALIHHHLGPLDPRAPWRDLAQEAVTLEPANFDALVSGSTTLPEHWQRLQWLQRAQAVQPNNPWVTIRIVDEMKEGIGLGRLPEMLALTERVIQEVERGGKSLAVIARLQRAALLHSQGQTRSALAVLEPAAARYSGTAPLTSQLALLDSRVQDQAGALRWFEAARTLRPGDPGTVKANAELLLLAALPQKAIAIMEPLVRVHPEAFDVAILLASAHYQQGHPDQALATLDAVLARSPGHVDALVEKARLLERLGRTDDAADAYGEALTIQPENRELEEQMEALRPQTESYDTPWRWSLESLQPRPDAATRYAGQDFYYLASQQVVHVAPAGQASRFTQNIVQVLTEEGARTWRSDRVYYSPGLERVDVISVRVKKVDGSIVEVHERQDYDAGQGTGALYYQRRFAYLDVGALEPGDMVEYTYRTDEVAGENYREGYFGDIWYFDAAVGVERARYVLITPEVMTIHSRAPKVSSIKTSVSTTTLRGVPHTVRAFEATDIPAVITDKSMPGRSEIYDYVLVSTYKTWDEVGKWWWNLVKDQLVVDGEIKKVVKEVTRGLKDDRARVRAIHNWVVKNTRYVGIEFGVHGWKPYRTTLCMQRRFGDCKDKASLIKVMMDEAGIPANLVLIRTNALGDVAEEPANLAIFNHAIAYVPKFDLFLDGTAEFSGTAELPYSDQGTFAIIVKDGGEVRVVKTPIDAPDVNRHLRDLEVDLTSGSAIVRGEIVATGADAVWYRRTFDLENDQKRIEELETIISRLFPGAKIMNATFVETRDLEKPVKITFEFAGGGFIKQLGDAQVVFPAGREIRLLDQYAPQATRDQDMMLGIPFASVNHVRYKLPDYLDTAALPADASGKSRFGSYAVAFRRVGDTVEMDLSYTMALNRISVAEYPEFRKWLNSLDVALNKPVALKPKAR